MFTQVAEIKYILNSDGYQGIKDEHLAFLVISLQMLTSSRISKSSYRQVVFSDCTFHACEFQGVTFDNCIFENCSFEYSHFRKSNFNNCNFSNCSWKSSSSINSIFMDCDLSSLANKVNEESNLIGHTRKKDHSTDIYIDMAMVA